MENLKWQYEGDILIFDDITLTNPTISVKDVQYISNDGWYINLLFTSVGQSHQRTFEMENVSGFDDLSQTEVIAMVSNEFTEFTQT